MTKYKYNVIIEPAEEGGYLARVPALGDLTTEGESIEEAKAMVADVIKGYIETLRKNKLNIPQDFDEQPQVQRVVVAI